ncbi:MAG: fluoride efflux transporter CrcB [Salinisphaera sp.]|jgi:CrcB protein|nr:fluoride efflux transporter CrcB [Salinisphaera sp.]
MAVSSWLSFGPLGTGALGLLTLGTAAQIALTGDAGTAIAQAAYGVGIIGATLLWGYGLWWLVIAVLATLCSSRLACRPRLGCVIPGSRKRRWRDDCPLDKGLYSNAIKAIRGGGMNQPQGGSGRRPSHARHTRRDDRHAASEDHANQYDPQQPHSAGQTTESESGAEYAEDKTMPLTYSILAIALGAALGANLRWGLGLGLNGLFPNLPPGTLVANLLGAFLIGIAIATFSALPELSSFWRLMVVTGFLGALTTFSTFSAEMFTQIQDGRLGWAFIGIAVHVAGSLVMTGLGMLSFSLARHAAGATS